MFDILQIVKIQDTINDSKDKLKTETDIKKIRYYNYFIKQGQKYINQVVKGGFLKKDK